MSVTAADRQVDAFERFFLDEHPKLVALGLAWTGDPDAARDLAQEAMVRTYASWDRVSGLDIPGAWVRRVMINLLIDRGRSNRRTVSMLHRLRPSSPVETPDTNDDAWWQAVRALPDRERAAVTLHYVDDLPIAEVASILDIAPGTVKASLSHARDKLRARLGPTEATP